MRCSRPFISGKAAYPCGQCAPCLKYRARVWSHRIVLESLIHDFCSFVTLTYAHDSQRSVDPTHTQRWLKRFRRAVHPTKVRYYLVGEYGDKTHRPHYHVALFGWPPCVGEQGPRIGKECQCQSCCAVRETWRFGHVSVLPLEARSAQYIAGYVLKKMTMPVAGSLLGLRRPFSRMSLRPGIGADVMWDVASETMRWKLESCPALLQGGIPRPLGRYLRNKLLEYCGEEKKAYVDSILPMVRSFAWEHARSVSSVYAEVNGSTSLPVSRGTL